MLVRSALTTRVALHCVDAAILDGGEPRRWLRLLATGQFRHMRLVGKSSEPVDSVRFAAPTANGSYWPGPARQSAGRRPPSTAAMRCISVLRRKRPFRFVKPPHDARFSPGGRRPKPAGRVFQSGRSQQQPTGRKLPFVTPRPCGRLSGRFEVGPASERRTAPVSHRPSRDIHQAQNLHCRTPGMLYRSRHSARLVLVLLTYLVGPAG